MTRFVLAASVGLALTAVLASQALRAPAREPVVPVEVRHPTTDSEDEPAPPPRTDAGGSPGGQQLKTAERQRPASPSSQADFANAERKGTPSSRPGGLDDSDEPESGSEDEEADRDD